MPSRFQDKVLQDRVYQDNVYPLPRKRGAYADGVGADGEDAGGENLAHKDLTHITAPPLAANDLLFVDLSYAMAARLCPQGHIRKLHPAAIDARLPRDVPLACALFGVLIDGFEMTALLNRIGYQGQLTIVRPALPDPELIRAELTAQAQGFRLRIIRDHWLGGAGRSWTQLARSERAQPLRKTTRLGTIPRR